ncbi:MAG: class I SAM-dependent DNA methyltransferase [Tepidisphaerales bacterium]
MTASASATAAYRERARSTDYRLSPPRAYGRYAVATKLRELVVALAAEAVRGVPAAKLLDLGCGDMPYRTLLEPLCGAYDGADLPGNAMAKYAMLGGSVAGAEDGSYDVVLSTQVLEHVAEVGAYLAEAHRLLRPGGRLVLTTHGTWVYHADPHDYWRWTAEGLRSVVTAAGFEVLELRGILGLMPMGLQLFQDGLVRKLPRPTRNAVCLVLQQLVLLADRFHTDAERARDACIYGLIARRRDGGEGGYPACP